MTYSEYGVHPVRCIHCQSENVQRRIGRIRIARSDDSRMDDFTDMPDLEGLENDPKALGRMMRKMKNEVGDDMGDEIGPEFDEVVDRLEKGQSPEDIEKAMPDLAKGLDEAGGGMGGFDDAL
jgi:hypothetical protein